MLPSRGVVRSLPQGVFQRSLSTSRSLNRKLGDARQFGTVKSGLMPSSRIGVRNGVAPLLMGGVASKRALSLWGYGKKADEPVAATTTTTTTPTTPIPESTTPEVAPKPTEAVATPVQDTAVSAPAEPLDPMTAILPSDLDLNAIAAHPEILNIPENIGFLSQIGLDYGLGPTSIMQWVLEHVHVYSGFGWGGSIVATALLLRVVMFYPQVRSLHFNAAMQQMRKDPQGQEAMELVKKGYQTGDREMIQKGQFLNKVVREQYGASNLGLLWTFLQIPFSFGLFRIISGMVHIPVPSLENAGFLWFTDLTASDPYFLLPAIGSGFLFGAMAVNGKYAPAAQKAMMKKMMWLFGGVGFIGTTFLSAGVNLMMVSTGSATLLTAFILNNETVRRKLGLPIMQVEKPAYQPPRVVNATGVEGLRERLTGNLTDMKKSVTDQVTNYTGSYAGTEAERAEKKRKETIRKLETIRKKLENEEFEKKYKQ